MSEYPHDLATRSREAFIQRFAHLYEHSPWVIEKACDQVKADSRYNQLANFHQLLCQCMLAASADLQDALINAHPMLAGKKAMRGELTDFSTQEQKSAGLNDCSDEEIERFNSLNETYLDRFGFPFIMAVRGKSRQEVFDAFVQRLDNSREQERARALDEINAIAWLRIEEIYGH